ncbi:unnamed protein product [Durusdinium trenchii]|uniref:Uncharacterized protein n=1 Tax=Durusdinium trenchii TaxID=1381693 RepID=A0ABP0LZ32_9DINO
MPIGLWELKWDSASIMTRIFEILVSEKLGYKVVNLGGTGSSTPVLYRLGGCEEATSNPPNNGKSFEEDCLTKPRRFHFSFESWQGASTYVPSLLQAFGDRAPINLGSLQYKGSSGMYVLGAAVNAGLLDSGLSLEYYSNYNADWFQPSKYTAIVSDVNLSRLATCDEGVNNRYIFFASEYVEATGDTDAVYLGGERVKYKCWEDKWWISPACRSTPQNCSTLITRFPGWGFGLMTQWVAFHNMPVAIGTAAPGDDAAQAYVQLGRELASLVYWWTPDVSFLRENASPIVLPPFNPAEHARKIFRTSREEQILTKWAAADMDVVAHRAFSLAGAIALSKQDVASVLLKHLELKELSGDTTHWDTACTWLKQASTASTWQAWIPSDTTCPLGRGLVDSQRNYVTHRDLAVACAACPAGMFSQESGETRVSQPCPAGSHQSLPGEAVCEACQPGTSSAEEGMVECAPCGLGKYANFSGMKTCIQCGANITSDNEKLQLFTTSQLVVSSAGQQWIPVQGASSEQLCGCVAGAHRTSAGLCALCPEGAACEGSRLLLLQGYYSKEEDPGSVFKCHERSHCPGGLPGACAEGRDPASVACNSCLPGLHSAGARCIPCEGGDYALVGSLLVCFVLAMSGAYVAFTWQESKSARSSNFVVVACGLGQLATSIQVISVIHQFSLDWGEPIASLLALTESFTLDLNILSFDCLTPSDPVPLFLFHVMVLPSVLALVCIIHFCTVLAKRSSSTWQFHRLGQAVGSLCVVFFIAVCSSSMPPLICQTHPNKLSTVRAYPSVNCNGREQHLAMILITTFAFLLPALFLASSIWVVLQIPSKINQSDLKFIRAASFLFGRFRPGAETLGVWLLLRNALLVFLPLASQSVSTFLMNILLSLSLMASCYVKPWRMKACNDLDIFLTACMIFIVTLGSHVAGDVNEALTITASLTLLSLIFLSLLAFISLGCLRCFREKQKAFRYFLSHHKSKAGSLARWLKMLILQRGKRFTTFIDADDLCDLTKLFWHVAHETVTLVILASPDLLKRKWCVGEMVTARMHEVHSVVIAWPQFVKPTEAFIQEYASFVPDIVHLGKHNICIEDVQETFRWMCSLQTLPLPTPLTHGTLSLVVNTLTGTLSRIRPFMSETSTCCILSDPENSEAVAAAFVFSELMSKEFSRTLAFSQTLVMTPGELVPEETAYAIVVCTGGCLKSFELCQWIVQLGKSDCRALPVFADEEFKLPGPDLLMELMTREDFNAVPGMAEDLTKTIKAVLEEIGIMCMAKMALQDELELRARQIVMRLTHKPPAPLCDKLGGERSVPYFSSMPISRQAPDKQDDYVKCIL